MKVALFLFHPFSESMGSVVRVWELARGLEQHCIEVYIMTPYERSFDLSKKIHVVSINNLINTLGLSRTLYRATKVLFYNKLYPYLFSKSNRLFGQIGAKLVREIAAFLREKDVDIIQIEQDAFLPLGISLKKVTGLPLVVDVHNIASEELVAAGFLEEGSDQYVSMQNNTMHHLAETDHVVVVSDEMRKYVVDNYMRCYNDISVVPPGGRVQTYSEQSILERKKPIKVVYAGLVAYRERVDLFVRSMPFIKGHDAKVSFYITSRGDAVKGIKKLAEKLHVEPVFFWYDNYRLVDKFLSTCHVGVLPSSNDRARRMGTPVKLFSYLSAGVPIVANDVGGWTEIIKHENVGLLTSDDPEEFGEAVLTLVSNPKLMQEYAHNGLELIRRKYNWDNSAYALTKAYKQVLS